VVGDLLEEGEGACVQLGRLGQLVGQLAALEMDENGLGYNNLLYMSVLLAALAAPQDEEPTLRVLLVEEREAHR
jgi:putative ATP-dependent endonuclease of OLD family